MTRLTLSDSQPRTDTQNDSNQWSGEGNWFHKNQAEVQKRRGWLKVQKWWLGDLLTEVSEDRRESKVWSENWSWRRDSKRLGNQQSGRNTRHMRRCRCHTGG